MVESDSWYDGTRQADHVRLCHQGIADIREVPHGLQGADAAQKGRQPIEEPVPQIVLRPAPHKEFEGLLPLIGPADHRGEGEQGDADADKAPAQVPQYG